MGFHSPGGGAATTPAGADGQIQFGYSSLFDADPGLYFDNGSKNFGIFKKNGSGGTETISFSGQGSIVGGLVLATSTRTARIKTQYSDGSFAFGFADAQTGTTTEIFTYGKGSFAMGKAYNGTIQAGNGTYGSFAFGSANGFNITATGDGSLAFGSATAANISASATNSAQFFEGSNTQAGSLSVGTTVRLKGTTGAPTSPRNGDIWVNSNYVYIRSNGVSVKIT